MPDELGLSPAEQEDDRRARGRSVDATARVRWLTDILELAHRSGSLAIAQRRKATVDDAWAAELR